MENENPEIPTAEVERPQGPIIPDTQATSISASSLVASDKDRPIADAVITAPASDEAREGGDNDDTAEGEAKKRGRKKMSDEEKAQAKRERDAFKAAKGNPDFAKILGTNAGPSSPSDKPTGRNYFAEAVEIFVPCSFAAGKMLGDHWGIKIKEAKLDKEGKTIEPPGLDFTEDQKQYLQSMARWLEYEQFPPMDARMGMIIASAAYGIPRAQQAPTPERVKGLWKKCVHVFEVIFKNKK